MRHPLVKSYDPGRGVAIAALTREYAHATAIADHAHGSDQFVYATRGLMEVAGTDGYWLVPPQFAIWVPARVVHRVRALSALSLRTLYFRAGVLRGFARQCRVLAVTPLLRELVLEVIRVRELRRREPLERALRDLVVAQVEAAPAAPTFIPMPLDRRALAIAEAVLLDPATPAPLAMLCTRAGVSVRTAERAFQRDLGIGFEDWRRQVRLVKAVERLARGEPVKRVALDVGYRQPSAFIDMFRRTLGQTPGEWQRSLRPTPTPAP
jgi:AraC-like DNA-binding protein/mannose-6-phosphate isomerase-like protein (cupin superfamily)